MDHAEPWESPPAVTHTDDSPVRLTAHAGCSASSRMAQFPACSDSWARALAIASAWSHASTWTVQEVYATVIKRR